MIPHPLFRVEEGVFQAFLGKIFENKRKFFQIPLAKSENWWYTIFVK